MDVQSEPEMCRVMLVLTILAHSHVWGERPFVHVISACVSKPFVQISEALEQCVPAFCTTVVFLALPQRSSVHF